MDSLFCLSETLERSNPDFSSIRALSINNEPWFVGIDVAQVLGYSNTRDALNRHIDNDDRGGGNHNPLRRSGNGHHQRIRPVLPDSV